MLHKFRRFYYNNKIKIWKMILIIASILIIIQMLNYIIRTQNINIINNKDSHNQYVNNTSNINNKTDTFISSNTSSVTGEQIDNSTLEEANEIINNFITSCNNKNIEEAYSYLSSDCKEEIYSSIDDFKTLYYDNIFGGEKKTVLIENWIFNTYKVDILEDIMTTGNINNKKTQDYMTVVKENDTIKLNINNFIKKEELNVNEKIDGIKFNVLNKKVFINYEEYDFQIENYTGGNILLDSRQNTKSIYIKDNNNTQYYSYSHELLNSLLKIDNGFSSKITIKFYKEYSQERQSESIVFSDIILNYNGNMNENNIKEIEINL